MRQIMRSRLCVPALFALLSLSSTGHARDAYRLATGDTVKLSILGVPELTTVAVIDVDGSVSLPMVGLVPISGLSLGNAQAKTAEAFAGLEYRGRSSDGSEYPIQLTAKRVTLSVSEYNPIYVGGDVAHPGDQRFRAGMTAREAIVLAGGFFDPLRKPGETGELFDWIGQYEDGKIEIEKQEMAIDRLRSELAVVDGGPRRAPVTSGEAGPVRSNIMAVENQLFDAHIAGMANERAYLKDASEQENARLGILGSQEQKEAEGAKNDQADLNRYEDLFKKGAIAIPLISEARRNVLLSSTRALQTSALLASTQREHIETERALSRLDEKNRTGILGDIQDTQVKLAQGRARLKYLAEKLDKAGYPESADGRPLAAPTLSVVRRDGDRRVTSAALLDGELMPGDVLNVDAGLVQGPER